MHPATGVPKQKKCGIFLSHDVLGARRRGLGLERPRTCTIPARACKDTVAVPCAATGGKCCADRFAAHTLRRQHAFQKDTRGPLSWQVLGWVGRAAAPQSPCASLAGVIVFLWLLCRLVAVCHFWLAGEIDSDFPPKVTREILGVNDP
jgi:hypothetical protein